MWIIAIGDFGPYKTERLRAFFRPVWTNLTFSSSYVHETPCSAVYTLFAEWEGVHRVLRSIARSSYPVFCARALFACARTLFARSRARGVPTAAIFSPRSRRLLSFDTRLASKTTCKTLFWFSQFFWRKALLLRDSLFFKKCYIFQDHWLTFLEEKKLSIVHLCDLVIQKQNLWYRRIWNNLKVFTTWWMSDFAWKNIINVWLVGQFYDIYIFVEIG